VLGLCRLKLGDARLDGRDERIAHDVSHRVRGPDGRSYPYSDATGSVTPQDDGEENSSTPQHSEQHLNGPSSQRALKPP
jgi:hypothetical protein